MRWRFNYIAEHTQMRKKVEMLKDSSHFPAQLSDAARVLSVGELRLQSHIDEVDRTAIDPFQSVQAAQKRCLATAGRADNSEHALRANFE